MRQKKCQLHADPPSNPFDLHLSNLSGRFPNRLDLPSKAIDAALQIGADLSPFMYSRTTDPHTSRMGVSIRSDRPCSSNTQSTFKVQNLPKICLHPIQNPCTCTMRHLPRLRMIPNQPLFWPQQVEGLLTDISTLVAVGYTCLPTVWLNRYRADFSLLMFLLIFHVWCIKG